MCLCLSGWVLAALWCCHAVYGYLANISRISVGGAFKTVCPAGCNSGGCHGPLTRMYGLGVDNVLAMR